MMILDSGLLFLAHPVSSLCILVYEKVVRAVSRMLYSKRDTARHSTTARHVTTHTTLRTCRVVMCSDVTQQMEFGLYWLRTAR